MSHTPTPWKLLGFDSTVIIRDEGEVIGETICEVEDLSAFVQDEKRNIANAAFIVGACNAHAKLVEALIDLRKFTFIDRWAQKGLDDEAQTMLDTVNAALEKVGVCS